MQFYKYPKVLQNQHCSFEFFKGSKPCNCGKPAVGQLGKGKHRKPLCKEHFNYVREISGVKSGEVKGLSKIEFQAVKI
jgi:hypothetical protein